MLTGTGGQGHRLLPHFPRVYPLNFPKTFLLQMPRGHWSCKPEWWLHFWGAMSSCLTFIGLKKGGGEAICFFCCDMGGGCSGPARLCSPVLGPPAPWQGEARAGQRFGDEPFPGIKEGKFGVGLTTFSLFISHSSLDHWSKGTLPLPSPFPSTQTVRCRWWLILQHEDVPVFQGQGDTVQPDLHGTSLPLRSTSRITAFSVS